MVVLYNSATLCHVMPCYAMLCHAMPHYAIRGFYQKFSKKKAAALKFYHKIFYATLCHCLSMPPSKVCCTSPSHSLSLYITSIIISQLYVLLIYYSNNNDFAYINHHVNYNNKQYIIYI